MRYREPLPPLPTFEAQAEPGLRLRGPDEDRAEQLFELLTGLQGQSDSCKFSVVWYSNAVLKRFFSLREASCPLAQTAL